MNTQKELREGGSRHDEEALDSEGVEASLREGEDWKLEYHLLWCSRFEVQGLGLDADGLWFRDWCLWFMVCSL